MIIVEYVAFDSPKRLYQTVTKRDLLGDASVLELIAGWHQYPASSIKIIDLIPQ